MSKNNEDNNILIINNSSGKNLNLVKLHTSKNQNSNLIDNKDIFIKNINYVNSSNNISSKNTNIENESQNAKSEDKKSNLNETSNKILKSTKRESSNSYIPKSVNRSHSSSKPEIDINCKKVYHFRVKTSKIYKNYTPKKIASTYYRMKMGNISVKKNSKLGIQKSKNSPCNEERKHINKNKTMSEHKKSKSQHNNDFVQYVNNDKFNFKGNILNMNLKYNKEKCILPQSNSYTKVDKVSMSSSHNKINNTNFNYINYNIYKNNYNKKKELMVLSKNNNTYRKENENNKINNINSFVVNNIPTSPNSKNHVKSYFMNITNNNYIKKNIRMQNKTTNIGDKNRSIHKSNKSNKNNINHSEKNIYFVKSTLQRRKTSFGKKNNALTINKDNINNRNSFSPKNKNIKNISNLNNIINKNIKSPEELHFFYIKILQNGSEISKKFDKD